MIHVGHRVTIGRRSVGASEHSTWRAWRLGEAARPPNLSGALRCADTLGIHQQRGHGCRLPIVVNRDERELRSDAGPSPTCHGVFALDDDCNLHRCSKRRSDARLKANDLADPNRQFKLHVINERGYRHAARMSLSTNGAAQINPRHDLAAENAAQRVRMLRKHVFCHLREARLLRARSEGGSRGRRVMSARGRGGIMGHRLDRTMVYARERQPRSARCGFTRRVASGWANAGSP